MLLHRKQEFEDLISIQDNYPKYVVSLDEFYRESDHEGVKHIHLREFLTKISLD